MDESDLKSTGNKSGIDSPENHQATPELLDTSALDSKPVTESKINLPTIDQVKDHVQLWTPELDKEYQEAVSPLYETRTTQMPDGTEETKMVRVGIMDFTHDVQGTDQQIHNIGTAHDKNPYSEMNTILRERVQNTLATLLPISAYFC
ncbi:MAG: hypothetical protein NZM26_01275 [Patescibacteria group bacterium]|nr:hypothetical protein [Patescibacteria group bacterium]